MTRSFAITAFAALTTLTTLSQPVMAGNAGASLGDCYNHVISACNQTNHPQSCAGAGMDACDEYHAMSTSQDLKIKIKSLGGGKYKATLMGDAPERKPHTFPSSADDADRDNGRSADRDTGRGGDNGGERGGRERDRSSAGRG